MSLADAFDDDITMRSSFLIRYKNFCLVECHELASSKLKDLDDSHSYSPINEEYARVTTTLKAVEDITNDVSSSIQEFAAVLPVVKIDMHVQNWIYPELRDDNIVDDFNLSIDEDTCLSYFLLTSSLPEHNLEKFKRKLLHLSRDFGFSYETEGLEANQQRLVSITMLAESAITTRTFASNGKCTADADKLAIEALASMHEIVWIERKFQIHHCNRFAKGLCQSGDATNVPMYNVRGNLTGHNQIIGIADTGLDMSNCYFRDPKTPTPYSKVDHNHRKVNSL